MPSATLLPEEKSIIRQAIGHECQIFTATIARLYLAESGRWSLAFTGAVAFMKDLRCNNAFFLRMVDLQSGRTCWEQELYRDFQYAQLRPFFHSFFTDTCTAGLSFADENEAQAFYMKVSARDTLRVQSKHGSGSSSANSTRRSVKTPISQSAAGGGAVPAPKNITGPSSAGISSATVAQTAAGSTGKKKKFDKSAIGAPTDFRHVTHVGFDEKRGGFSMANVPAEWAKVFRQAGVTDEQLTDEGTAKFIYDFMTTYEPTSPGGTSAPRMPKSASSSQVAVNGRGQQPAPPPLPTSARPSVSDGPPPVPSSTMSRRAAPPPPPSRAGVAGAPAPRQAPPPPPARPPPPPSRTVAPPPPPPQRDQPPPSPGVSAPIGGPPPPPPPPAPSRMPASSPAAGDYGGSSGYGGSVPAAAPPPTAPRKLQQPALAGDLLASIRGAGGMSALKPAAEREVPSTSQEDLAAGGGGNDVAHALKMALASRQTAMATGGDASDNSGEESGNDDDW